MRAILYSTIFLLIFLSNNLLGQVDIEKGYYQANQVDFKFRTDNPKWLPEEQIENTIDFLLENTVALSDQFRIKVSTDTPIDSFGIWVQQHIASYLREHDLESSQLILTAVESIDKGENDWSKEGRYAIVLVEHWEKMELAEVPVVVLEEVEEEIPSAVVLEEVEEELIMDIAYDNFMAGEQEKSIQTFKLSGKVGQTIIGEKGTVIHIPAYSFVDAKGNPIMDSIQFVVKEVYSLKDMLIQDLTTMSGEDIIETGGMLYLEATTLEGEQLELGEGKVLLATMASTTSSLKGMQTFDGVEKESGKVDWIPTGNEVILPSSGLLQKKNNLVIGYSPSIIRQSISLEYGENKGLPALPTSYSKPTVDTTAPIAPIKLDCRKISKAEIMELNPIQKGENRDRYNKRIGRKVKQSNHKYYTILHKNKVAVSHYQNDIARYRSKQRLLRIREQKYKQYAMKMKEICHQMAQEANLFDRTTYERQQAQLFMAFRGVASKYDYMLNRLDAIQQYDVGEYSQLDSIIDLAGKSYRKLKRSEERISLIYNLFRKQSNVSLELSKNTTFSWSQLVDTITNLDMTLAGENMPTEAQIEQIITLYRVMNQEYRYNQSIENIENNQQHLRLHKNIIRSFLEQEDDFIALEEKLEETKKVLGIITPQEFANQYGGVPINEGDNLELMLRGTLTIEFTGWVNCDRSFNLGLMVDIDLPSVRPGRPMDCEVWVEQVDNARFYIIFEDIEATIMPTDIMPQDGRYLLTFKNVPRNLKAQLIGMKIGTENRSGYYEQKGKIKELHQLTPSFETVETTAVLDTLVDAAQ